MQLVQVATLTAATQAEGGAGGIGIGGNGGDGGLALGGDGGLGGVALALNQEAVSTPMLERAAMLKLK